MIALLNSDSVDYINAEFDKVWQCRMDNPGDLDLLDGVLSEVLRAVIDEVQRLPRMTG